MSAVALFTHRRPQDTHDAVLLLLEIARRRRITLRFTTDEAAKHEVEPAPFIEIVDDPGDDVFLCIALGGDGTILTALRRYAGTGIPVFGVNYGEVGFLATIDPDGLQDDFDRAFSGEFDTIQLPTVSVGRPQGTWNALNDISVHRKAGLRVADLAYALAGEEIGRVRCDGLVVATPQGSTGYNLANGGPVLAWGVEGYVVSFIAPHSLTARALVVAPGDELTINNASREEPVEVHVDGRPTLRALAWRGHPRRVRPDPRDARPAAGRVVLPPPARALRPPVFVRTLHQKCNVGGQTGPIRPAPLVDPPMCSTNCASRTSC